MKQLKLLILLLLLQPLIAEAVWVDHRFPIMGTEIRVRFWLADEQKAEEAKQAVVAEMHHINNTMTITTSARTTATMTTAKSRT